MRITTLLCIFFLFHILYTHASLDDVLVTQKDNGLSIGLPKLTNDKGDEPWDMNVDPSATGVSTFLLISYFFMSIVSVI